MTIEFIPYGRQDISEADIQSVVEVLRSEWLTQGPAVPRFEKAVATYSGVGHAIAMNSATSALHVACLALGLGEGDWLWTSPNTFVASANCALYCGARVDFVDIDPSTYNMSVAALGEKLATAEKLGKLPKIVVPVHFAGQSCDMEKIRTLGNHYGFKIIEDASHAIGGKYQSEPIGNCRYSDIAIFSFHPVKIVTTAEGGMALTNDADLAEKMTLLRSHGITRDPGLMTHAADGPWYYQQIELGYNYRMTDMQAALGASQMARLDEFVGRRHELVEGYDRMLVGLPLTSQMQLPHAYSSFHLYVVCLDTEEIRKNVFESLRAAGIGVNVHYIPVHLQPYYQSMGFKRGDCPEAESYYRKAVSLPMYAAMGEDRLVRVVEALAGILKENKIEHRS